MPHLTVKQGRSIIHAFVEGREITAARVEGPHRVTRPEHLTDTQFEAVEKAHGEGLVPPRGRWITTRAAGPMLGCGREKVSEYARAGYLRTKREHDGARRVVARGDVKRLKEHLDAGGKVAAFDPMQS